MSDARLIISAIDQATAEISRISGSVDGMVSKLKGLAGGLSFGFAVREFVQAADAVTLMNARLQLVTDSVEEFNEARAESYRIAQANNLGLSETTELYTKLSPAVKSLGGSTKEVSGIVDAFATSLRVGGANTQAAAAATLQFAQAMASGRLNGDEFRTMAETSPRFMKALADGMGVTTGALKDMSKEGKLTADIVGNALLKELSALKDEAAKIPDTVGGAFQRMKNDALLFVEQVDKATGASGEMAEVIGTTSGLFREFGNAVGAATLELDTANQQFDLAGTAIAAIGTVVETLTVVFANVAYVAKTTATEIAVMWQQAKLYLSGNAEEARRIGDEWTKQAEANRRAIDKFSDGVVGATDRILQQRDALKNHSISAKEASAELERMAVRSGKTAGEFAKLASNTKDSADQQKAAKKAADEYGKAAKDVLELTSKSLGVSGDYVEKLRALELWYSKNKDKTNEYVAAVESLIRQQPFYVQGLKEQEDAQRRANKETEDAIELDEKQRQQKEEAIGKARLLVEGLEQEASALSMTNTEREIAIRLRDLEKLGIEEGSEAYRIFAERIREAVVSKEAVQANIDAAKTAADTWKKTGEQIEEALTKAMVDGFNSGKSVVKSIGEWIKNYFLTNIARSIAQALTGAISTGLSGIVNAAVSGGAGGGSSGGGILDLGSNIVGLFGAGGLSGSLAAGAGWLTGATTLSGALGAAGSLIGTGSGAGVLAGLGMGLGALAPIALGAYALSQFLGNDRSPAQQNYSVFGRQNAFSFTESAPNLQSSTAYDDALRTVTNSVAEIANKLGGAASSTSYGLFSSASPDNLGAQVVAAVTGANLNSIFYSDTNASNESMAQRIADALPQMLLAGLQDANLPEEFAKYFSSLQVGSATAQQINDAIAAAIAAAEEQTTEAEEANIVTARTVEASVEVLQQQLDRLGMIYDAIVASGDKVAGAVINLASRPIDVTVTVPEVNGGLA